MSATDATKRRRTRPAIRHCTSANAALSHLTIILLSFCYIASKHHPRILPVANGNVVTWNHGPEDHYFCGRSWDDPDDDCATRQNCRSGRDEECEGHETHGILCFAETTCDTKYGGAAAFVSGRYDVAESPSRSPNVVNFGTLLEGGLFAPSSSPMERGGPTLIPTEFPIESPPDFAGVSDDPKHHWFCGVGFDDANSRCEVHCPTSAECPTGEICYFGTSCDARTHEPTPPPTRRPTVSPTPRPTVSPSVSPTTAMPTVSHEPTETATTPRPTEGPTLPQPTAGPTMAPVPSPSSSPLSGVQAGFFCGASWSDTVSKCKKRCPSGEDTECPGDETCFDYTGCRKENGYGDDPSQWVRESVGRKKRSSSEGHAKRKSDPRISNSIQKNEAAGARRSGSRASGEESLLSPPRMSRRKSDPCCNSGISNATNENAPGRNRVAGARRCRSAVSRPSSQTLSPPSMPRVTEDEEYRSNDDDAANNGSEVVDNNSADRYEIGQTLAEKRHSAPFASLAQATALLTELPLDSPLFVKRTSGEWTYAVLADRATNDSGKPSLVVHLKDGGKNKKILERRKWERCLRLVVVEHHRNESASSSSVVPPSEDEELPPSGSDDALPERRMLNDPSPDGTSTVLPDEAVSNSAPSGKSRTTRKSVSFGGNTTTKNSGNNANNSTGRLGRKLAKKNENAIGSGEDGPATISSGTVRSASTKSASFRRTTASVPSSNEAAASEDHHRHHRRPESFRNNNGWTRSKPPRYAEEILRSSRRPRSESAPPPHTPSLTTTTTTKATCTDDASSSGNVSPGSDSSPTAVAVNLASSSSARNAPGGRRDRTTRPRRAGGEIVRGDDVANVAAPAIEEAGDGSVPSNASSDESRSRRIRRESAPSSSTSAPRAIISPGGSDDVDDDSSPAEAAATNLAARSFRASRRDRIMRPRSLRRGGTTAARSVHHRGERRRSSSSANDSFFQALGSLNKSENVTENMVGAGGSSGGGRASLGVSTTRRSSTLVDSLLT